MKQPIVDVVFEQRPERGPQRYLWPVFITAFLYGAGALYAASTERTLEQWSSELAVRVHAALSSEQPVELEPPPPTPPPPPPVPEPAAPTPVVVAPTVRRIHAHRPPAPAAAGRVLAARPQDSAPVDLTGDTFVTGSSTSYSGGTTTSTGTNPNAVHESKIDPKGPTSQARSVGLQDPNWRCPWPKEAEAAQIDEQIVMVQVVVGPRGEAESVNVVTDPGHGFGPAAVACAERARFVPARDSEGNSIRSKSPPIRVRFTR